MLYQRGKAYSQDLRERVFAASDGGMRVGQIAAMLLVSVSYVSKVLSRRRLSGERTARPQHGHVPAKLAGHHAAIRERVRQRADATIGELRAWLQDNHEIAVSTGLMWKTLAALGLTLKKRPCTQRSRTVRMSPSRVRHGARLNPS
jgi:transposase